MSTCADDRIRSRSRYISTLNINILNYHCVYPICLSYTRRAMICTPGQQRYLLKCSYFRVVQSLSKVSMPSCGKDTRNVRILIKQTKLFQLPNRHILHSPLIEAFSPANPLQALKSMCQWGLSQVQNVPRPIPSIRAPAAHFSKIFTTRHLKAKR